MSLRTSGYALRFVNFVSEHRQSLGVGSLNGPA